MKDTYFFKNDQSNYRIKTFLWYQILFNTLISTRSLPGPIDGFEIENPEWLRHNSNQYGFLAWVAIGNLEREPHRFNFIRFMPNAKKDTIPVDFFNKSDKMVADFDRMTTEQP